MSAGTGAPTSGSPAGYRADIDGLRAVAVLLVLMFHADLGLPGGFVGVDVFFVISGYLITGLILSDLDRGRFRILDFFERRVRRILPALAVVLVGSLVAGWFLLLPLDFEDLGDSVVAQVLLVSNVHFKRASGYFEQAAEAKPLLHVWSLAVEEQFYLLLPFLLIAIRRVAPRLLVPAILLLCALSFGRSVYIGGRHASANFYLLPTRAWELLLGALLAATPAWRAPSRWLREMVGWGGLLAILCAALSYDRETRFPGVTALLPCGGAAALLWANTPPSTSVNRVLASAPMVFVGLMSYSLYLWHWPVLVFFKYGTLGPLPASQRMLLLLGSAILAALSFRFVESPFRNRAVLKRRIHVFSFAGVTAAVLLLAGLAISRSHGAPSRLPAEAVRYADGRTDRAFLNELGLRQALAGEFTELGAGDKQLPIHVLVWGDSHAMAALPMLDVLCKEHAVRGAAATHSSTPPLVGYESRAPYSLKEDSVAWSNAVVEFIRRRRVGDVVLVAVWSSGEGTTRTRRCLLDTLAALQGTGARIWILRQVPRHPWNVPRALASAAWRGGEPEALGLPLAAYRAQSRREDALFEGIAAAFPLVTVLDPTTAFLDASGRCRVAHGGKALYSDEQHLTVAGAMALRTLFEPIFSSARGGGR